MVTKPTGQPNGRPATGETPPKRFRPPPALWEAAQAVAAARGETMTDALVRGLHWYVDKYGPAPAKPPPEE